MATSAPAPPAGEEKKPKRKHGWRGAKIVGGILLALVLLLVAALLALQIPAVQGRLADIGARYATAAMPYALDIEGVSGLIPWNLRVARLALADAEGDWLTIEDAELTLDAAALLFGQVQVKSLTAARILFPRLPTSGKPAKMPRIPALPGWLNIDEVHVPRIELGEAVAGEAATLEATLQLATHPQAKLSALIERRDREGTRLALNAALLRGTLTLDVDARDETLLPQLADLGGPITLTVLGDAPLTDWSGNIALDIAEQSALRGDIAVTGPEPWRVTAALDAQLTAIPPLAPALAHLGDTAALALGLQLTPAGLLTIETLEVSTPRMQVALEGNADLPGDTFDLDLRAAHDNVAQYLPADEAGATPLPASLSAHLAGTVSDLVVKVELALDDAPTLDTSLALSLGDEPRARGRLNLQPPPRALPPALQPLLAKAGYLDFEVQRRATGTIEIPRFNASLPFLESELEGRYDPAGPAIHVQGTVIASDLNLLAPVVPIALAGDVRADVHVDIDRQATRAEIALDANGIVANGSQLQQGILRFTANGGGWTGTLPAPVRVESSGQLIGLTAQNEPVPPLEYALAGDIVGPQEIRVESLRITGGSAVVTAQGEGNIHTFAGKWELKIDAPELAHLTERFDVDAGGALTLTAATTLGENAETIEATISAEYTGITGVAAPLGSRATLAGDLHLRDGVARIAALRLDSPRVELRGGGTYTLETERIEAQATATVASLAAFEDLIGAPMAGSAQITLDAKGTRTDLAAAVKVNGRNIAYAKYAVDTLDLDANIAHLANAPEGVVKLTARGRGETLEAEAVLAYDAPELRVSDFALRSTKNFASGNVTLNTETTTGQGEVTAELNELAVFGRLLNIDLAGRALVDAKFAGSPDEMQLTARVRGDALDAFGVEAEALSLEADLAGSFDAPRGDLLLVARNVDANQATVADARVEAQLDGITAAFELNARGTTQELPYDLSGAGRANLEARVVELSRLEGTLDQEPLTLEQPATIRYAEGIEVSPVAIRFAGAGLDVAGTYGPDTADLRARVLDFPLSELVNFGGPELYGRVSAEATLSGPLAAPQLTAHVDARGLRLDEQEGPALGVVLDARLAGGVAEAEGRIAASGEFALDAAGRVPVQFSLAPFAFTPQLEAPLDARVEGGGDLSALMAILGPSDHLVAGGVAVDLRGAGTPRNPSLDGQLQLENARYENTETGTILDPLDATLVADGRRLVVQELNAGDGGGGTVTGEGYIGLASGIEYDISLTLADATLVRRDDVSGAVSGTLQLAGAPEDTTLRGQLRVGPATAVLPEPPPPAERTIDVVEVRNGEVINEPLEEDPAAPLPLTLDLAVAMPGRVFVRGPGIDTEWSGDLTVTGNAGVPSIRGQLNPVRGRITYLGRTFEFTDSSIIFNGEWPPSPYIDANAQTELGDIVAYLNLRGDPANLVLTLSSVPAVPQDEILAQILFGQGLDDITPLQAIQIARVAALLARRQGAMGLAGGGPEIPGIDRATLVQGENPDDIAVQLGTYLSDNLYVEIQQGTGPESTRFRAEYEITDDISIDANLTGQGTGSEVGVYYKKDY